MLEKKANVRNIFWKISGADMIENSSDMVAEVMELSYSVVE